MPLSRQDMGPPPTDRATGAVVRLELPMPPSVWEIYTGWGKSRHLSSAYASWRNAAGWAIKGQVKGRQIAGKFSVSIALKRQNKLADLDNRAKAVLDCLQHCGVIKNDNLCERISMTWDAGLDAECVVLVQPYEMGMAA